MADIKFAWGTTRPTNPSTGGIYVDKQAKRMYISTDAGLLLFNGMSGDISTTLENNSWEVISTLSQSGEAANYWSVGDTKDVTLTSGETITLVILGFNHDSGAGITFGMQDCLNTTYLMNSSATNVGGWNSSVMRTSTMETLYSLLPPDLQSVIVAVPKLTSAGNTSTTITTTSDKLFLLSEIEVWGTTSYSASGEGTQYAYYANGGTRVKSVNGSPNGWWLRSPYSDYTYTFCNVDYNGNASINNAHYSSGVSFGFGV